jgi:RNA polymerase sigma-70 factor, ECF subfamily
MTTASLAEMQAERLDSPRLLARARAGDAESFWSLCEPLQPRLVRQALALCRDELQAADLTQETLIAAWRSIRRFNGQCQFGTWLCSILFHKHRSALRRSRWLKLFANLTGADQTAAERIVDGAPTPDRAVQISERSHQILLALERLPARQREVIFLRFYADESLEGIAAAMSSSAGTTKSRLYHALENLRQMRIFREELR